MVFKANTLSYVDLEEARRKFDQYSEHTPENKTLNFAKAYNYPESKPETLQEYNSIKRSWSIWDASLRATHVTMAATAIIATAPLTAGASVVIGVIDYKNVFGNVYKMMETYPDLPYCEAYKLSEPTVHSIEYNGKRYVNTANFEAGAVEYNETEEEKIQRVARDIARNMMYERNHY